MRAPYSEIVIAAVPTEFDDVARPDEVQRVANASGAALGWVTPDDAFPVADAGWELHLDDGTTTYIFQGPDGGTFDWDESDKAHDRAVELLRSVGRWSGESVATVEPGLNDVDDELAAGAIKRLPREA